MHARGIHSSIALKAAIARPTFLPCWLASCTLLFLWCGLLSYFWWRGRGPSGSGSICLARLVVYLPHSFANSFVVISYLVYAWVPFLAFGSVALTHTPTQNGDVYFFLWRWFCLHLVSKCVWAERPADLGVVQASTATLCMLSSGCFPCTVWLWQWLAQRLWQEWWCQHDSLALGKARLLPC